MTDLALLEAVFVRILTPTMYSEGVDLASADGVRLLCPTCRKHSILLWFSHVSQSYEPNPGRWKYSGAGLKDLTLEPSINSVGHWHGYIKDGLIITIDSSGGKCQT